MFIDYGIVNFPSFDVRTTHQEISFNVGDAVVVGYAYINDIEPILLFSCTHALNTAIVNSKDWQRNSKDFLRLTHQNTPA